MAKSPSRSVITSALASAVLASGLVAATAGPASAASFTFTVTTSPPVQYAQVSVSLRDDNGWDQGGDGSGTDDEGAATFSVDAASGTAYVLTVSPPTDLSDDSAPFLATGTLSGDVATNVVFPTKNITYTVVGPDGVTPVPGAYVSIGRPFVQDGQRRGATNIVGGPVNSNSKYFVYLQDGSSLINSDPEYGWEVTINPPADTGLAPVTFDDTWNGLDSVDDTIALKQANVRAIIEDPQGNRYSQANVSLETLQDPDQDCRSQQIANSQVASPWANGSDDTFNAYTDPSITPGGGYIVALNPRRDDTTVVRTEIEFNDDDTSTSIIRTLRFDAPNVVATVVDPDANPVNRANVSVSLYPRNPSVCFNRNANTGTDGKAYLKLNTDDSYEITVMPPQDLGVPSKTFIVTGSEVASGAVSLPLSAPNIAGSVDDSSGAGLAYAKVTVQGLSAEGWLETWFGEVTADSSGAFQFYVDPELAPYGVALTARDPNGWSSGAATRLTIAPDELPALAANIQLDPVNFAGQIIGADGQPLNNAWINGRTSVGVELGGSSTNSNGEFAMYVPGTVSVSSPLNIGVWIQEEQRYVQRQVTELSTSFSWQIPSVNLGVLVTADGSPAEGAQVSLLRFNGAFDEWIDGGRTGEDGVALFALDDTTSELIVEVQPGPDQAGFATAKVTEIPQDLGDGTAGVDVELSQPNTEVLVEAPIGLDGSMEPLPEAFVYVQPLDDFSGTGAMAADDGVARLILDDTTGVFSIYVSPPYYMQGELTEGRVETEFEVVDGIATATVQLTNPNVGLFVRVPGTVQTPLSYAQVEVRNPGDAWGFAWSSANERGTLGLTLDPGEYELVVRPPSWLSGMSGYGSKTFWMSIGEDDVTIREGSEDGADVLFSEEYGVFVVEPSTATYSATVELPTTPAQTVANSWVEVLREVKNGPDTWYEWADGASTGRDGTFGLTLKDDTYVLIAQPVWGDRTYAPSAPCYLVVEGGQDTTSSSGLPSQCDDTLTLRSPNLVFTVRNPNDSSAVANAWICPTNTYTTPCVSTGRDGRATFFIDDTPSIPGGTLELQIEAPWGSTGLAGTRLEVPVNDIGTNAWTDGSQNVNLASPNVTIRSWRESATAGNESTEGWVSIFTDDNTFTWIGGAAVNRQGRSLFNIDDTSVDFCIDAWPGWGARKDYGPVQKCGVDLSSGLYDVTFQTANVKTVVVDADGRTNAYGWVEIIGPNNSRSGASLDDRGRLATYLDDTSATYSLTFYPAWQRTGTPTTVSVTFTDGVANIADQVTLSEGNVRGTVTLNGEVVAGVLVIATPTGSGSAVATVSDATGAFRMSLPAGSYTVSTVTPTGSSGTPVVAISSGGSLSGSTLSVGS